MLKVSFFSYKGGAGRTSVLYNTLPYLAERLKATETEPIIVLDLDLDSKGLTYLANRVSNINTVLVLKGDMVNLRSAAPLLDHPFFKELSPIGADLGLQPSLDRSILFVSAPQFNNQNYLGERTNYDGGNASLQPLMRLCMNYKCKAIVIDTPTGDQLASTCALKISNKIVTVMRITKQFRKGTEEFLRSEKVANFNNKEFIIVPNAVPDPTGTDYNIDSYMREIARFSQDAIQSNSQENRVNLKFVENGMKGINEVNLFKFSEENLKKEAERRKLTNDELKATEMFKLLAEELADEKA